MSAKTTMLVPKAITEPIAYFVTFLANADCENLCIDEWSRARLYRSGDTEPDCSGCLGDRAAR
jgi:hypothetical protein